MVSSNVSMNVASSSAVQAELPLVSYSSVPSNALCVLLSERDHEKKLVQSTVKFLQTLWEAAGLLEMEWK